MPRTLRRIITALLAVLAAVSVMRAQHDMDADNTHHFNYVSG